MFKRFPSYTYIADSASQAFRRFPFTLLSAIIGTILVVILIELDSQNRNYVLERIAIQCGLGIALFTALAAYAEKHQWSRTASLILQASGVVLLALHFFSLPDRYWEPYVHPLRIAIFALALHLLVALLPWLGGKQVQGFWQYNKSLFLRILHSALYSAVMFAGLAIALAAVNVLFELNIDGRRWAQLWVILVGIFNTWIFLAGFPEQIAQLNEVDEYPRGLRIFTQYILLPLVGLYLVILYAYELKIIINWSWPIGWVSQLVLWYSVVSILSLLLLWPLRNRTENLWIKTFSTWFFRLLVPLIVMLFLAIFERVGEYGVTANRYLVIAMAIGLAAVVLYFILSRAKDIRVIPIVVFIVAMISAIGPWSAFSVAERSQQNRLKAFIAQNDLSFHDTSDTTDADIPFEDQQQMSSIVDYLADWHGPDAFEPWLSDSTLKSMDTMWSYQIRQKISDLLGFDYVEYRPIGNENQRWFYVTAEDSTAIPLAGYDYFAQISVGKFQDTAARVQVQLGEDGCSVRLVPDAALQFSYRSVAGVTPAADSVAILDLTQLIRSISTHPKDRVPRDSLALDVPGSRFRTRVLIQELSGWAYVDSIDVNTVRAYLLFDTSQ